MYSVPCRCSFINKMLPYIRFPLSNADLISNDKSNPLSPNATWNALQCCARREVGGMLNSSLQGLSSPLRRHWYHWWLVNVFVDNLCPHILLRHCKAGGRSKQRPERECILLGGSERHCVSFSLALRRQWPHVSISGNLHSSFFSHQQELPLTHILQCWWILMWIPKLKEKPGT